MNVLGVVCVAKHWAQVNIEVQLSTPTLSIIAYPRRQTDLRALMHIHRFLECKSVTNVVTKSACFARATRYRLTDQVERLSR